MILIDANILLYARNSDSSLHRKAHTWLDGQLNGSARVGLPWASLLAFMRISTNRRAFPRPLTMADAWDQVSQWLACDPTWIPAPTDRHADILAPLLALPAVNGNLISDAHLAALALEHGLTLCSTDGDFARFPGLRWLNPMTQ